MVKTWPVVLFAQKPRPISVMWHGWPGVIEVITHARACDMLALLRAWRSGATPLVRQALRHVSGPPVRVRGRPAKAHRYGTS